MNTKLFLKAIVRFYTRSALQNWIVRSKMMVSEREDIRTEKFHFHSPAEDLRWPDTAHHLAHTALHNVTSGRSPDGLQRCPVPKQKNKQLYFEKWPEWLCTNVRILLLGLHTRRRGLREHTRCNRARLLRPPVRIEQIVKMQKIRFSRGA